MRLRFEDDDLRRLYVEADYRIATFSTELIRAFRKQLGALANAVDERDLYALKSLHFEKLRGTRTGQSSIRLNRQWRLILRIETNDDGKLIVIVEVVDYH